MTHNAPSPRYPNSRRSQAFSSRIGANIKAFRIEAGLSLIGLANVLDISYQQLQKYESGANQIPTEKLYLLKIRYGIPWETLFADVPVPERCPSLPV